MPLIRYVKNYAIANAGRVREVSNQSAKALVAIGAAVYADEVTKEEAKLFQEFEDFAKVFKPEVKKTIAEISPLEEKIAEEVKPKRGRPVKK